MSVSALVTVIVTPLAAVVPGVTVTVFPLILHVAAFVLLDLQLNAPPLVFFVTVNDPAVGYVILPVFDDKVKVLLAFAIVTFILFSSTSLWLLSPTTL